MFYFLFGSDTYSIKLKVNSLINKFQKEEIGLNITKLDGSSMSLIDYKNSVASVSLFSEKKLIIISNIIDNSDKNLAKYIIDNLENIPDGTTIIFTQDGVPDKRGVLYKALKVEGKYAEYGNDDINKGRRFLESKLKDSGIEIEHSARFFLLNLTSDLWLMGNIIEKMILVAMARNEKTITKEMLEESIVYEDEPKMYELTEMIAQKKTDRALNIFHQLITSGINELQLFVMIVNQQRKLLMIEDLLSKKNSQTTIATKLKMKPYPLKRNLELISGYGHERMKNDFILMQETDVKLKSSDVPLITILDLLIIKLCS